MRTESDAGQFGLNFAKDGANLGWRAHLRIERLDVGRTAVEEQENDGLVGYGIV